MSAHMRQRRRRGLGLGMATALVVGNMIGSGVFLLPSSLARYGGVSIVAWLLTAAGAVLLALVFARLGRAYPQTGGPYAYSRKGFGDFVGFQTAWGYWIAIWAGNAAIAVAFVSYLSVFWGALATNALLAAAVAVAAIWTLTAVNALGVRHGGWVQAVTTVLKLVPLLAIATIPRSTIIGTLVTALVYILGTVAVMGVIPAGVLAGSNAPFADAAAEMFGGWAGDAVAIGAIVSAFGALNGWILLQGQIPMAAARDRLFPAALAKTGRSGAPVFGLVTSSVLVTVLLAMNYTKSLVEQFTFIVLLATLTTLVPYAYSAAAQLMLLVTDRARFSGRRLARDALVALLAFGYSLWAIAGAGYEVVFKGFLLLLAGIPIYVWLRWRAARAPTEAEGLTVEELLPPIPDKPPSEGGDDQCERSSSWAPAGATSTTSTPCSATTPTPGWSP